MQRFFGPARGLDGPWRRAVLERIDRVVLTPLSETGGTLRAPAEAVASRRALEMAVSARLAHAIAPADPEESARREALAARAHATAVAVVRELSDGSLPGELSIDRARDLMVEAEFASVVAAVLGADGALETMGTLFNDLRPVDRLAPLVERVAPDHRRVAIDLNAVTTAAGSPSCDDAQ